MIRIKILESGIKTEPMQFFYFDSWFPTLDSVPSFETKKTRKSFSVLKRF